jgi:hypothetical protein
VRPRFHGHSCPRHIREPLLNTLGIGPEAASIDHFSFFVERAVMAPDVSKVDTDGHLNPGLPAWDFRLLWLMALLCLCKSHHPSFFLKADYSNTFVWECDRQRFLWHHIQAGNLRHDALWLDLVIRHVA